MAVTKTDSYVSEKGNGTKVAFDFEFKIFAETDIKVYTELTSGTYTLRSLTTDYTVEYDTEEETGTVTYVVHPADPAYDPAPPNDLHSVIKRNTAETQGSSFPREAVMPQQAIENALDKLTLEVQELTTDQARIPKLAEIPVPTDSLVIDTPTDRRSLVWEADGDDWNIVPSVYDPDVSQAAAAASAAAAAVSASAAAASAAAAAISAAAAAASAVEAAASAVIATQETEGLLSARPATPATMTRYWATDIEQYFLYSPLAGKWIMLG